jgi:hypothetical protein
MDFTRRAVLADTHVFSPQQTACVWSGLRLQFEHQEVRSVKLKACTFLGCLMVAPLICGAAYGQSTAGNIPGRISDAAGAVIPAAQVKAANMLTDETRTAGTSEIGEYIFPSLPVGRYRIEADVQGFGRSARSDIELTVNQNARVDIKLQVGTVEQRIEVSANASAVNAYDVQSGYLVDTRRVAEPSLNRRNVYDPFTTLPGVSRLTSRTMRARDNNGSASTAAGREPTASRSMAGTTTTSGGTRPAPARIPAPYRSSRS